MILSHIIGEMLKNDGALVVAIDELHRVIREPEAAPTLDWMAREARHYTCGFWVATQKVEDITDET